jgi:hypothetical protein
MREDMARVIVQRPRIRAFSKRGMRRLPLEELPAHEGMRRPHELRGCSKSFNENLAPLRRYLERQVGRPWNKVYSEIAARLHTSSTVQQHVRDHLQDFVALCARRRSRTVFHLDGRRERHEALWHQPLYVDPRDGTLKRTDRVRRAAPVRRR